MTAYGLISLELYRGIKFEVSSRKSGRGMKIKTASDQKQADTNSYTSAVNKFHVNTLKQEQKERYYTLTRLSFSCHILTPDRQTIQHWQHQAR